MEIMDENDKKDLLKEYKKLEKKAEELNQWKHVKAGYILGGTYNGHGYFDLFEYRIDNEIKIDLYNVISSTRLELIFSKSLNVKAILKKFPPGVDVDIVKNNEISVSLLLSEYGGENIVRSVDIQLYGEYKDMDFYDFRDDLTGYKREIPEEAIGKLTTIISYR